MQFPLNEHLVFLNDALQQLRQQLTQSSTEADRAEIEAQIEFVTQTIEHYRRAYEMERALREGQSAQLAAMD